MAVTACEDTKREAKESAAPFHNFWDFLEKIGPFNLLFRGTPCHVVREQVGENSLAQGNAEASKEEKAYAQISADSDGKR
jgi:hypothetical protein